MYEVNMMLALYLDQGDVRNAVQTLPEYVGVDRPATVRAYDQRGAANRR